LFFGNLKGEANLGGGAIPGKKERDHWGLGIAFVEREGYWKLRLVKNSAGASREDKCQRRKKVAPATRNKRRRRV